MNVIHETRAKVLRQPVRRNTWDRRRRKLAIGAVLMTLPYSALKLAWILGSRIGLRDDSFGTSTTMHVLNTATLGLDLVALTLAVIFFVGARAPKWLILPTMWVGYGLLGQIVVVIAPSVAIQLLHGPSGGEAAAPPIAGWVYAAVYTGFSGLGICLLPAFAIHAWQRWGTAAGWGQRLVGTHTSVPSMPVLTTGVLVCALLIRTACAGSAAEPASWGVDVFIGLVALGGLWSASSGRPGGLRRAVPLLLVWTASGAWAAWGVYHLILGTVPNDLVSRHVAAVDVALGAGKAIGGAVLLLAIPALARGVSRR